MWAMALATFNRGPCIIINIIWWSKQLDSTKGRTTIGRCTSLQLQGCKFESCSLHWPTVASSTLFFDGVSNLIQEKPIALMEVGPAKPNPIRLNPYMTRPTRPACYTSQARVKFVRLGSTRLTCMTHNCLPLLFTCLKFFNVLVLLKKELLLFNLLVLYWFIDALIQGWHLIKFAQFCSDLYFILVIVE